ARTDSRSPRSPPLAHPRRPVPGAARHRRRQHHPQRRAPDHRARARGEHGGPPVDRGQLHPRVRRPPPHHGHAGRPLRPQASADRRARAVRGVLAVGGAVHIGGDADRRASLDGHRRSADHARDAVDPHERLPARGARQGDRGLGRRVRAGDRHRPDGRRAAARALLVGCRLPGQRPVGGGRRGGGAAARPGIPGSGTSTARPAGCRTVHRRVERPRLRAHRRPVGRLDRDLDAERVRRRRGDADGLRALGAPRGAPDARRQVVRRRAVRRRERGARAGLVRALRGDLLPDPAHAGRARLHAVAGGRAAAAGRRRADRRRAAVERGQRTTRHPLRGRRGHDRDRHRSRRDGAGRRRQRLCAGRALPGAARARPRHRDGAGDRVGHERPAAGQGRRRLGGQRHGPDGGRRSGRRRPRIRAGERVPRRHGGSARRCAGVTRRSVVGGRPRAGASRGRCVRRQHAHHGDRRRGRRAGRCGARGGLSARAASRRRPRRCGDPGAGAGV
ncbi:MAG: Uncharacterized MFS-type transporter, partial [uncultured Pseudonocardia sp.]